jgi:hypothetical protein
LVSGYAAGEKYIYSSSYTGGASNRLCLPSNPELSNKTISAASQLYGTEYDDTKFGSGAYNEDVPCAVCRSTNTSSSLMIPGRKSCFAGWKKEYDGIIAIWSKRHRILPDYLCKADMAMNHISLLLHR